MVEVEGGNELDLPIPEFSVVFFVMTFGVGYTILVWAYSGAKRLHEWNNLDAFDKTLRTFAVGGIVTFTSFILLNAPLGFLTNEGISAWWNWFWRNIIPICLVEIILIWLVKTLIQDYLSQSLERTKSYIS